MRLRSALHTLAVVLAVSLATAANAQSYFEGLEPSNSVELPREVRVETRVGPEGFTADFFDLKGAPLGKLVIAPDGTIIKEVGPDLFIHDVSIDRAIISNDSAPSCGANSSALERCKYRHKVTISFCIKLIGGWCWCWSKTYYGGF